MVKDIKMYEVDSSNIDAIGWDEKTGTLEIKFHSGATYQYFPILKEIWDQFLNSASKGSYFIKQIRNTPGINATKL